MSTWHQFVIGEAERGLRLDLFLKQRLPQTCSRTQIQEAIRQGRVDVDGLPVKPRHLVRPGLSGWAQLYGKHAHHGVGLEETRDKLSCDLYYIQQRSLVLDLAIALKTIKKLLTRSGV